jgi:hypothetical protein
MRGSDHSTDFRRYRITSTGAVMGESLIGYRGITTGVPTPVGEQHAEAERRHSTAQPSEA